MPKHIKSSDPDAEYVQGHIRLVMLDSTIYLYLKGFAHPSMTRKCGDFGVARIVFSQLRNGLKKSMGKPTLWERMHEFGRRLKR